MGQVPQVLLVSYAATCLDALPVIDTCSTNSSKRRCHQLSLLLALVCGPLSARDVTGNQPLSTSGGDIEQAGPRFIKLGRAPTQIQTEQLWLVVRVNVLPLSADHEKLLAQLYRKWRKAGAQVTGIQIDFDAATHQLHRYAASLRQLRQVLPTNCKISVTGLLDWAQTGDIAQLNSLPVDEIVIQTYQGKRTVPGYNAYLPAMMQFRIPFKVGLVQGGDWNESWQKFLSKSQYYKGEVVFLVNQPHGSN